MLHLSRGRQVVPCLVFVALGVSCDACEEDRTVPFGLDRTDTHSPTPSTSTDRDENLRAPEEGQRFDRNADVRTVDVEGASLRFSFPVRALLARDLDRDGDRDVLAVTEESQPGITTVRLVHVTRTRSTFSSPRTVAQLSTPIEGTPRAFDMALRALSGTLAVATIQTGSGATSWLTSLEASPRLRETVVLAHGEPELTLTFEAIDADDDGHRDLVALLAFATESAANGETPVEHHANLTWLNRPGGLTLSPGEPEASLVAMAENLASEPDTPPESKLDTAGSILTMHRALCREASAARVTLSGATGVTCGPSAAAGRAAAARVVALARLGRVAEATAAVPGLRSGAFRISASDRRRAEEAVNGLVHGQPVTIRTGPSFVPIASPKVKIAPVGFLDEQRILIRGTLPKIWNVSDNSVVDSARGAEGTIRDPTGTFTVSAIERSCQGYELVLVRTSDVAEGLVLGAPVSRPLLTVEAHGAASCPDRLPTPLRNDTGGWQVLGWAPQGIVATSGAVTVIVPLNLRGQPAGMTVPLRVGAAPPAPVPPGAMTAMGEHFAIVTEFGILVRDVRNGSSRLVRPPEWPSDSPPAHVAPSPNGQQLAYVHNGRVILAELR